MSEVKHLSYDLLNSPPNPSSVPWDMSIALFNQGTYEHTCPRCQRRISLKVVHPHKETEHE